MANGGRYITFFFFYDTLLISILNKLCGRWRLYIWYVISEILFVLIAISLIYKVSHNIVKRSIFRM